ncbi:MAG: hemerythrin family protein [Candidatus Polarisedimenticolaceae bacterium]|nr:hemerythrin family protein [Candidatus Polarisedimenticolaceae bacterium]
MLAWDQKWSVGVEGIDLQHRYFIDLINRIYAETEARDTTHQTRLINELGSYTQQHFMSEENIMHKLGFPGMEKHCATHQELLERLNGQIGLYLVDMLNAAEIASNLADWLIPHVTTEDREFAGFVRQLELQ